MAAADDDTGDHTATADGRAHPSRLERLLPGVHLLRSYRRADLPRDLAAGTVLVALLVPAGMGYAVASGLAPAAGLYATVVALVVYALTGPNRVLVYGPDSALAPTILAAVVVLSAQGVPPEATAAVLGVLVGVICLAGSLLRLGSVAELLSRPIRFGYLNGIAVTVIVLQAPTLLGFDTDEPTALLGAVAFVRAVADGAVVGWVAVVGLGAVAVLVALRRLVPRIPGALVVVVATSVGVWLVGPGPLSLVGDLPGSWPTVSLHADAWAHLPELVASAVALALVAFADTSVLSRTWGAHAGQHVDPNDELRALGAVNVAVGALGGFPVSSSASRTPVAVAAGARTQLTGLTAAVLLVVLLVVAPWATRYLPGVVLAAVVVVAVASLIEIGAVWELRRASRSELAVSVGCTACVLVLGVLTGIFVAVAASLALFVSKAWRPHSAELVRVAGLKGYHDVERHPEGDRIPHLALYRFDAPLFFANAEVFRAGGWSPQNRSPTSTPRRPRCSTTSSTTSGRATWSWCSPS